MNAPNDNMSYNTTFSLHNDKLLGFAEFGAKNGFPVFHFHSTGSSRFEGELFDKLGKEKKIRIIGVDRPGFGLSEFQARELLDWPNTLLELVDFLEIDNFSVMGISGGGPHAIACAYSLSDKLENCIAIGSPGPPEIGNKYFPRLVRLQGWIFKHFPFFYVQYMKRILKISSNPVSLKSFVQRFKKRYPPADAKFILEDQGEYLPIISRAIKEGTRESFNGAVQEMKIFSSSWGFNLKDISTKQKVVLWHGEDDMTYKAAQEISELIPNCVQKFFQGEGHFSVFINHLDKILDEIIS
ncbi:MAG: alpha/beta fold hydrolase [Promethearchaeota archaeon]